MRAPPGLLMAAVLAAAAASLPDLAVARGRAWLELFSPREPESASDLSLVEVRGQAGARGMRGHDLVVAIDVSDSTTQSSGVDLDGDGPEGRTGAATLHGLADAGAEPVLLRRLAELDLEDSILFAELAAAEVLLKRLQPQQSRVGLVAFSDEARVLAPLGSDRPTLRSALRGLRRDFHQELRGTHLADAIETSLSLLRPDGAVVDDGREASILLLSDGAPTLPVHDARAKGMALAAAEEAGRLGVRIYSFAIGEALEALDVFREVAALSGGRLERIERPADAIARLRRVDLADLAEVHVLNLTSGSAARALRTFPDGSFDALVLLVPGANRLRVTAIASDGGRSSADRLVTLTSKVGSAEGERELLDVLRRRTRETRLWAEVERGRDVQVRELDIQAVED